MPLIEIHATGGADVARVSGAIAEEVAAVLNAAPDVAWIVWHRARDGDVWIGSAPATGAAIAHVYLTRTPAQVDAVADAVARTLERELGLDAARVIVCTHAFAL